MSLSTSFRHFRALSRKNAINWKRTPLGSVTEIICPVILMLLLVYGRRITKPELLDNLKVTALRHPIFQPAKPDGLDGQFQITLDNVFENAIDLNGFMKYSKYTNIKQNITVPENVTKFYTNDTKKIVIDTYFPPVDPLGPYLFYPRQCYSTQKKVASGKKHRSQMIAYIKQGNQIEQDLIDQMEAIFKIQRDIGKGFKALEQLNTLQQLFPGLVDIPGADISKLLGLSGAIDEFKLDSGIFSQLDLNSTDTQASLAGQTQFGDLGGFDEYIGNFTFRAFDNQTQLDDYISARGYGWQDNHTGVCFAFAIKENESKDKYELDLQFNDWFIPQYNGIPLQKDKSTDSTAIWPDAESYTSYSWNGFAYLQNWVANTILKRRTNNPNAQIVTLTVPTLLPRMKLDFFGQIIQQVFTFFVLVMYIPPLYRTVYRIVAEKESRAKESMRMMGLGDFAYWSSWYAYYTTVNFMISCLTWLMLNGVWKVLKRVPNFPNMVVFGNTNDVILFVAIFLFGQSLFGLILITQSIFSTARAAAITTTVIYFGSSIFYQLIENPNSSKLRVFLCCLSPTVAMIKQFYVIGSLEASTVGANFHNISSDIGGFSVAQGFRMLILDTIILYCFGYYLEKVMPKTFGVRKHPCFCCFPSTLKACCSCKSRKKTNKKQSHPVNAIHPDDEYSFQANGFVEETFKFETRNMNPQCYERIQTAIFNQNLEDNSIKIQNFKKTYENGFQAVNGINLKLFSNQIFVLLGHNGAGKTSTISMLTGLYTSTEGAAEVFGYNLADDLDTIRGFMGVCPQHDVLFELLTPEEHLDIFFDFKGGNQINKQQEIEKLLVDVGVADKRKAMAYQLSGGNKRKLSVAIALCGGSKFVLLDEPTSGLDLSARRELWNMLREYKKDKIILLTTHYMDEADILGDRIGIMSSGKMTCLGSSMFLKNKFGVGYHVAIEKTNPEQNTVVLPYFEKHLGYNVRKFTEVSGEMSIAVPTEYSHLFQRFFTKLDQDLDKLMIRSYGVQITTLEQVFLKIGHMTDPGEILNLAIEEKKPQDKLRRQNSLPLFPSNELQKRNDNFDIDLSSEENKSETGTFKNKMSGTSSKGGTFDDVMRGSNANSKGGPDSFSGPKIGSTPSKGRSSKHDELSDKKDNLRPSSVKFIDDLEQAANIQEIGFNLENSKTDQSFCSNLQAVLSKRANLYKRNRRAFVIETFLPPLLILIGTLLSKIRQDYRSPSKVLSPDFLPLKQKILLNRTPVDLANSDVDTELFAQYLPMSNSAFEVTYDSKKRYRDDSYEQFAWSVFDFGQAKCYEEPYLYASYDIYQASKLQQQYKFISHMNITAQDAVSLVPQFMYESILKVATGNPDFEFKVRSTAYPLTNETKGMVKGTKAGTVIFFTAVSYSIVITTIVSYLVNERISNLKHVQQISGMQITAYWAGNFIFDWCKVTVTVAASIIIFEVFKADFHSALIAYALFPFGILPFTYCMSFIFTVDSAAQTFTMFLHFLVILVLATMIFAFRFTRKLELIGDKLTWILRIIPSYTLSDSIYFDAAGQTLVDFRNKQNGLYGTVKPNPYYWQNNTANFGFNAFHFCFWFFVLYLIESDVMNRCLACCSKINQMRFPKPQADLVLDDDVVAEAERINQVKDGELKIKVKNFRKVYMTGKGPCNRGQPMLAVEGLSFGLAAGECFALLGVNGAGKSTTFKSLTNEVQPTSGSIEINSIDIQKHFSKVRQFIGYCPQTNPIFDQMTVEEHLYYFARIKGIPKDKLKELVEEAIAELDLESHRTKEAGQLSGGNKRKLAVAMAIVGRPPIILLDEPSAGMDPEARRFMWSVVAKIASNKTSAVILTTHSMEEAEALSTKMGIMVKGGIFKCFGSAQHIRHKFGQGYIIEFKIKQPTKNDLGVIVSDFEVSEHSNGEEQKFDRTGRTKEMVDLAGVHQKLRQKKTPKFIMDNLLQEPGDSEAASNAQPQNLIQDLRHLRPVSSPIQGLPDSDSTDQKTKSASSSVKSSQAQVDVAIPLPARPQQHEQADLQQVGANDLAYQIYTQTKLYGVLTDICKEFNEVEMLEKYGSYMKIRVSTKNRSLGTLFGLVERMKTKHGVSDYSVSQTTLEQIFQSFANLKFDQNIEKYSLDAFSGELVKLEKNLVLNAMMELQENEMAFADAVTPSI